MSLNSSYAYIPIYGIHNWNTHTLQLLESPHCFPDPWSDPRATVVGKAKWKILEMLQKHYSIPEGTAEFSATLKNLKVRVTKSYHIFF